MMLPGHKTAAMGDMICWMAAIVHIAENYNFVNGHLIVPRYFFQVAANVLHKFPQWQIHADKIPERLQDGKPLKRQLEFPINATGAHLLDLGFIYFMQMTPPPDGADIYPELDLSNEVLPPKLRGKKFIVMTPVIGAVTRMMPVKTYNKIVDYIVNIGLTPVHLGKSEMLNRSLTINEGYDLTKGINLIDETTLKEAALIMKCAEMVVGIDNGLLHLAGMTDATILYGYTIAGPRQRQIKRRHGRTYELYGDKKTIPCLFCQEHVRFIIDHSFKTCLYQENEPQCVKALNAESFIATIAMAIRDKDGGTV